MNTAFRKKAEDLVSNLPYKQLPYGNRNWGHPWHSLCSYHGKLKPAIAHWLISEFTNVGDVILDPLCGVGTIPFEACLQGRIGIGNDLSELAYIVTKAKLEKPQYEGVKNVIHQLDEYITHNKSRHFTNEYENFGFNGNLPQYFESETYKEILCARTFFLERLQTISSEEAMVFSALLHVLHGNRPYALSRHSHPLTPYAPTGEYEYKSVIEKVTQKIRANYKKLDYENIEQGRAIYGDYKDLLLQDIKADCIICSPPFADSIRFYMQNWMRLWLCGWEPEDYKQADEKFLDKSQEKNFDLYYSFFEMCDKVLRDKGKVILHLGKTKTVNMGKELSKRAEKWFDIVYLAGEDVSAIEKHGIKDKGITVEHQYLFLQKK
jgi:hypothetical protein